MVEPRREQPPPTFPEPFPGFGEQSRAAQRDVRSAQKRLQEVELELMRYEKTKSPHLLTSEAMTQQRDILGVFPRGAGAAPEWLAGKNEILAQRAELTRQAAVASWFDTFYKNIPSMAESGFVSSLEEYSSLIGFNPTGILTEAEIMSARETISKITGEPIPISPEEVPDYLRLSEEEEAEVREVVQLTPQEPETIHKITVNELLKSLTRHPVAKLPEDWTPEQYLKYASIMDIPAEELERVVDITEAIAPYAAMMAEQEAKIRRILSGEEEWEMPEMGLGGKLLFAVTSPMQVAADIMQPYIENVSYPLAGFAAYQVQRWIGGTQAIEDQYAQMKAKGYNWWNAMSEAYQDWDAPWYMKLPLEIVTDPLTYIPGLALSIPGKLLLKVPITSIKGMGRGLLAFNKGLYSGLDLPFDAFKSIWSKLPKSFNQAMKADLDNFRSLMTAAVQRTSGRLVDKWTVDDVVKALEDATKAFAKDPLKPNDTMVMLGAELVKHAPLDNDAIRIWARSIGSELTDISDDLSKSVEDVISDSIFKISSPAENAKRLAIAFGINDTPQIISKLVKDLNVIVRKTRDLPARAARIGKSAQIDPVNRMLEWLVGNQKRIYQASARSTYAKGSEFSGIILSLMNKVDMLERGRWRMTLDRWLVRPMAEAYLGSIAYPIWNVFEGIFVSVLEGVVPSFAKQEAFDYMFFGIRGLDAALAGGRASDAMQLLRTMPGREGSVSLLLGKIPEQVAGKKLPKSIAGKDYFEWTGRKYIVASDIAGNALRRNFLMRKMANYLAEYSYNVAGYDLNAAFKHMMRGQPKISKQSLGLTPHDLAQEMIARAMTGDKKAVLAMKEMVSNSRLMQGEALKILRQMVEVSPQAKSIMEQAIASGAVFKGTADNRFIGIIKAVDDMAKQSIDDLRAHPAQAPDAFRFMADQIENFKIEGVEDLIQIFQHYEVMSESASHIPQKLLSQVFDQAEELKKAGKFNQLETLWRTSRQEVEQAVDGIEESLERIRNVIRANNSKFLKGEQSSALEALINRDLSRVQLQEQFMKSDGRLLDDFWALHKAQRTAEAHAELRAFRLENFLKFKDEDAVLGASGYLEKKAYSQLYYSLPRQGLIPVHGAFKPLSAQDVAHIFGCNVDALTTGMMESLVYQDKAYFIQLVKQTADLHPAVHMLGPDPDANIGRVYDEIVQGMKMSPQRALDEQRILQQAEEVKQRLIALKMRRSLTPDEEKSLYAWIDQVADGTDEIFGKEIETVQPDFGLGERFVTEEDVAKWEHDASAWVKDWERDPATGIWETRKGTGTGIAHLTSPSTTREELMVEFFGEKPVVGQVIHIQDSEVVAQLKKELTELGAATEAQLPPWLKVAGVADEDTLADLLHSTDVANIEDAVKTWFHDVTNDSLQILGWTGQHDKKYLAKIHAKLREHFGSDTFRLYRGEGAAGGKYLEREFTNATASRRTAKDFTKKKFTNDWDEVAGDEIQLDSVLVKVEDIVAIGSVDESEMIIPTKILRERLNNPLKPPTETVGGRIMRDEWEVIRQKASEAAHKDYYKAFADYTNQNIIDVLGKSIYPFWTYHMYRWFFLSRTFIRHPGTAAAWGKYTEYSDYGYVHIPGTDLEINPFTGSAFGTLFGLARHDFKSYYENLGWFGEVLDASQRRGWFPGIQLTLPIALTSVFSGRPPELGELLPPFHQVGIDLLAGSKIPVVADAANWLKDKIFHSNFHDYYTTTIVSNKQNQASGALVGGQSGVDLWFKQLRGESLTEEEQRLWDEARSEASLYGVLRSEFPQFRLRPEELNEAHRQVTALIEAQTGMTEEFQDNLWRHNLRPTDVIGGLPLDLRNALDQMWQWRIYFGRGAVLMPPEYSDLYNLTNKYYDKVERYQLERLSEQATINAGFLTPTAEAHYNGGEWRAAYSENWANYVTKVEALETDPEFADAIDAMTPEGQARLARELGFAVPVPDPMQEALRIYYNITLEKSKDPYTGEEDYNFLRFWLEREAVRMALPENQRAQFDEYIRRYQTPMEQRFKQVYNDYLRGYNALSRIVLEEFTEEEKALIAEFYADTTTRERKLEIKEFVSHSGKKLISEWDRRRSDAREALRRISPQLDFWLYVFGYISSPKTEAAKKMIDEWEKSKSSIVQNLTESPLLEAKFKKAQLQEETK